MATFFYKDMEGSTARGFNRTVEVYKVTRNVPCFIGSDNRIQTAGWKGPYAIACEIIAENTSYKMDGGYALKSKSVQLYEI